MLHLTYTHERPIPLAVFMIIAAVFLLASPAWAQAIKVTSAVPAAGDQGTLGLVVTIGGDNFSQGAKARFYVTGTTNPGGITVKNVKYKNSNTLEATIDIAPDAQSELKFDIEVTCGSRTGKGTELFKINVRPTCTDLTDRPIVYSDKGGRLREDLMLMSEDGTCQKTLLAGSHNVWNREPVWAPGGEWIAFSSNRGGYGIWVIKEDGTAATKVASTCGAFPGPSWRRVPSDGGTSYWIAYADYCSGIADANDLWAVEVSLGNPVLAGDPVCLTCEMNANGSDYWQHPAWSPAGMHLAANNRDDLLSFLYIFKVAFDAAGQPSLLVDSSSPWLVPPPEGYGYTGLIQASWAHYSDALVVKGGMDIWRLDVDLVNQTVLWYTPLIVGNSYSAWQPAWSADDTRLVAQVGIPGSGSNEIAVISFFPLTFNIILREGFYPDWRPGQ